MPRLIVNPGSDSAWEIRLQPGVNTLGRESENQFQIAHESVSSSHCLVVVSDGSIAIKDLGSTNGTFVNGDPVSEAILLPGQRVHLGSVELLLDIEADAAPPSPVTPPKPRVRLAIAKPEVAAERPPTAEMQTEAQPEVATLDAPPLAPVSVGAVFCKSHLKTPARFLCNKCHKYFCDLCVTTRPVSGGMGKFCRTCGVQCVPVQTHQAGLGKERGFFTRLPGAVVYPFRGIGLLILICATLAFAGLGFISTGILAIFAKIVFYGFLFLFMQNIIHTTTADENEPLSFPDASGLFGAAFQLGGTIFASYWLAIALVIARIFDVDVPGAAIIAAFLLGCFYFPMAFLAVAMKDSVLAANPLVVVPAILKMPVEYLVTAILLMSIFGFRQMGNLMSGVAGGVSFETRDMSVLFMTMGIQAIWAFVSVYLLVVNMRILGLLYLSKKEKFGWFNY